MRWPPIFTFVPIIACWPQLHPCVISAAARADDGLSHLALTDDCALYGAVAFAEACNDVGVQPITGMTLRVQAPEGVAGISDTSTGLLVLLATGPAGYRSLCQLSTSLQGHEDREACLAAGTPWATLHECREGLLCLSGGRRGWIERLLRSGDVAGAARVVGLLGGIYGENAYLSIELNRREDRAVADAIKDLRHSFWHGQCGCTPGLYPVQASAQSTALAIGH